MLHPGHLPGKLKRGDWVLVCSDGLTNHVPSADLEKMLSREAAGSAEEAARRLLNLVNLRGATDNATIVVVRASCDADVVTGPSGALCWRELSMQVHCFLTILFGVALSIHLDGAESHETAQALIKKEEKKLEGIWQAIRGTSDGEDNPVPKEGVQLIISKGKFRLILGKEVTDAGTLTIDPFKTPKAIEFTQAARLKTGLGIYQFKNDELWLCMAARDGSTRPMDFSCKKGSNHLLMIWKRAPSQVEKPNKKK